MARGVLVIRLVADQLQRNSRRRKTGRGSDYDSDGNGNDGRRAGSLHLFLDRSEVSCGYYRRCWPIEQLPTQALVDVRLYCYHAPSIPLDMLVDFQLQHRLKIVAAGDRKV